MKFTFEGNHYRIQFRHDKSRAWSDHFRHSVGILASGVLVCHTCTPEEGEFFRLSHVPKTERARRVFCTVSIREKCDGCINCIPLLFSEIRVKCPGGGYYLNRIAHGVAQVNLKAGDRFTREGGRRAAIENAVATMSPEFKAAVWATYNARKGA